jgi:hypothetical protein
MKNSLIILKKYNFVPVGKYKIPSKSEPSKFHIVKHYQSGEWDCDCIGFLMGAKCRHIIEAQKIWRNQNN